MTTLPGGLLHHYAALDHEERERLRPPPRDPSHIEGRTSEAIREARPQQSEPGHRRPAERQLPSAPIAKRSDQPRDFVRPTISSSGRTSHLRPTP